MTNNTISQLIKPAPVISPADSIRRAVGLIRGTDGSRILVLDGTQIVGSVSERAISAYLASADDSDHALDSNITPVIEPNGPFINYGVTIKDAAGVFANCGEDVLPVIDNYGSYQGMLYRTDVVGRIARNLKPPTIAGMATPLGVYLTTGSLSGGAGSFGLFLTGASLSLLLLLSASIIAGLEALITRFTGFNFTAYLSSTPLTIINRYDIPQYIDVVFTTGLFLLLMKLSPLSGYHAAEHMTVHAIEAGEALEPAIVSRMPRVHPRCGTNLLAAAGVFVILTTNFNSQVSVLTALLVMVLGWRSIGSLLQTYATTKTPNRKQLENGIAAGIELLDKYQDHPTYQLTGIQRVFKMGFIQTFAGMMTVMLIMSYIADHIPALKFLLY